MSTQTATASAPAAAPPVGDPNAFTPDELAMMDGTGGGTNPAATRQEPAQTAKPQATTEADGDDGERVDGEIEIGADGAPRDGKTGRFVPRSAFIRAKEQNKQLSDRTNRLAEEVIRSRERLAIFTELSAPAAEQQAEQPKKRISPEEDIFGAFAQMAEENRALLDRLEKAENSTKQTFERQELDKFVVSDAQRFSQEKPDFGRALQHALAVQDRIEERLGRSDPEDRKKAVHDSLRNIVVNARKSGKSWAQMVYDIALDYGYQPAAAPPAQAVSDEARAGIERINNGQAAAVSMRHSGSGVPAETMSIAKLADMPERQFLQVRSEYVAKNGVKAWDDFMNGKRTW